MSYLIDTNIISELRKGDRCDHHVAAWYAAVTDQELFLSVLTLGEIRRGVDLVRPRNPEKATTLERWLGDVQTAFDGQLLEVSIAVADQWGRLSALRSVPAIDGLLAATAIVHHLALVTRNDRDFEGLGATVLNPFKAAI